MFDAMSAMVKVAEAPEPATIEKLPEPGVDFPYYPDPTPIEFRPGVTSESIEALGPETLRGEGIEKQPGGKFWCGYCERDVQDSRRFSRIQQTPPRRRLEVAA
jgi:hypothetical protein